MAWKWPQNPYLGDGSTLVNNWFLTPFSLYLKRTPPFRPWQLIFWTHFRHFLDPFLPHFVPILTGKWTIEPAGNLGPLHCASLHWPYNIRCAQCNSFLFFDDRSAKMAIFQKLCLSFRKKAAKIGMIFGHFSFSRGVPRVFSKMALFGHFLTIFPFLLPLR